MKASPLAEELERILERSLPHPGAFDRFERRIKRRRLRERAFATVIAAAVVAGTVLAYLQLPAHRTPGPIAPPARSAVDGVFETWVSWADLKGVPRDVPLNPEFPDFLRLGTGRLRLILRGGLYQLIFYQDRNGPLYLRDEGTYRVAGDRLVLRSQPSYRPTESREPFRMVLGWSLSDGLLHLRPISDTEPWPENRAVARVLFGAHPWHRAG
ncbi:MAG: hypothetical protein M3Q23_00830 [Actinomycetota bacterium]|nr:hypothetical protein [Actinomycetota bacterium]